jgi:hypothetical protein
MSSLADLPELVGFFSYSREDDEDSHGALSALRDRIQRELRGQLGRSMKTFRLWQDKEAIASGKLWKEEINTAVAQSAFFIPIITPTVVKSPHCWFELETFLAREAALHRDDLVFPILYIRVPALEDEARQKSDPVLSIIAKRQYLDWREFRHREITSPQVKEAIERFCANICDALFRSWLSPEERKELEEAAAREQSDAERVSREAEAKRNEENARKEVEEAKRRAEADRLQAEVDEKHFAEQSRLHAEAEATLAEEKRLNDEAAAKRHAEDQRLRTQAHHRENAGPAQQAAQGLLSGARPGTASTNSILDVIVGWKVVVGIAGLLLLTGLAIYLSPAATGCFDSICGTYWAYQDDTHSGTHHLNFSRNNVVEWDELKGSYTISLGTIDFQIKNNAEKYHATLQNGNFMKGVASNTVSGMSWNWSASRY